MFAAAARIAAALALLCVPAGAGSVQAAIEARDVLKLEAFAGGTADERGLANGAALSLRHKDEAALAILEPLSRAASEKDVRASACFALSDIYLRQGRYADTHAALKCAEDVSGRPLTGEARQVMRHAEILSAEKPMQLAHPASGTLDVRRDSEGLVRVAVTINGRERAAVIDTDASYCVLGETAAKRLGVRMLEGQGAIVTSTRSDLPMRLGVADELKFGDAVLANVVFAVLPDSAVNFGRGYKMDVVVGLPVLVALRRIELDRQGWSETLIYGPKPGGAGEANLALSGLDPFVLAPNGNAGGPLRLALDTAASNTMLNATALKDFPALGQGAYGGTAHWAGGGGSATDFKALTLPELNLTIAGRPVVLRRVKLTSADEPDRHGMLGQDALKKGWVLDFDAMRFSIGE